MDERQRRIVALAVVIALLGACSAPAKDSAEGSRVAPSSAPPTETAASLRPILALRPCTQQDVAASFDGWGAAAGSIGGTFRLAPTSAGLCGIPDRPAFRLVGESGEQLLSFGSPVAQVTWVPVRAGAGKDATFVYLQWSNHGGDPDYACAERTNAAAALEIELPTWRVTLAFPQQQRPTFCAKPAESVFVQVIAR